MESAIVSVFLVLHALIHAGFVSPRPPMTAGGPAWPFDLAHSWLLSPLGFGEPSLRIVGVGLLALVVLGYAGAALSTLGTVPAAWFAPTVLVATVASIGMLAVFFHPWLFLGFAIDGVLLWATLVANWRPSALSLG
ncbi:MAG TPA: hypothetical protein VJ975_05750 [Candidatus Limnocylindria bacterium]|nr:hypothetical protein [Candidatus Limnocylindria bacterium]